MGNWGISPNASPKEKLKSEMADYLQGLNAVGEISYGTYNKLFGFSMSLLDKMHELGNEKQEEFDYITKVQSFIGKTIQDFFCNGFFGSDTYNLEGAEIIEIRKDEDDGIVIEVRKTNGKYDYGYFNDGWDDWKIVYEYLDEWVNGNRHF